MIRFGKTAAFSGEIGRPLSIELSNVGKEVSPGCSLRSITNADMSVFNLRAPLSGSILEMNGEAVENPELTQKTPCGKGWLLKVEHTDI